MSDGLIHFQCPVCHTRLITRAANAEQNVECPGCDSLLSVPFLPPNAQPDDVLTAEEAALTFRAPRADSETEMDMTPMVDVTFLLLIFFMVTAAFAMQKSFEVPTPKEDVPSSQYQESIEEDVITVRIDEFSTFYVSAPMWDEEQEAPSEQDLLRRLREARQGDGRGNVPNTLIVEAHGDALHEKVVMAMDAGTEVGMEEVKLRTIDDAAF
jgi:biopolymer transport protein ExbD